MSVDLYPFQKQAIEQLKNGSILCGGVGTGKSITSIAYYFEKECEGNISSLEMKKPKDLYIITTARKRDTWEWDKELENFSISRQPMFCSFDISVVIDSWNNISKYSGISDAFFIFDEQRVVGSGKWVKAFLRITKKNDWILLSATPGDTWIDYIPVFIANGFYKNRSEFLARHAIYSRYTQYPKIDKFVECGYLERLRRSITVRMEFHKEAKRHYITLDANYDKDLYSKVFMDRWNPWESKPIENISEVFYLTRKVVNSDISRLEAVEDVMKFSKRIIIFYKFDYELEMLRSLSNLVEVAEWNGHKHEPIPNSECWIYLVQYSAGAEGWNCTETDTMIFFSQDYSYKTMEQASGRIDRMNTPFKNLYYYIIKSKSPIDQAIAKSLKNKETFNETIFLKRIGLA